MDYYRPWYGIKLLDMADVWHVIAGKLQVKLIK